MQGKAPSEQLLADTRRRESFRASVYADGKGLPTQGYGQHDGVCFGDPDIDRATAELWLVKRLLLAIADARDVVGADVFDALDQVRADVLADLAYNLGKFQFSKFVPMLEAVRAGHWDEAGWHLLVSTAGTIQHYVHDVGARAVENQMRLVTGRVLAEFHWINA